MNFENGQKKAQPFGLANSNLRIQIQFMHATFHVFLLLVYSALRHVNSGLVFLPRILLIIFERCGVVKKPDSSLNRDTFIRSSL